ncbi:antitoxin HicB [Spirochaetia bacterium]|nr:antitoxin HicB [Spirochaetia bacterium]
MAYVYAAIFHLNNDGSYTITFPDLPGCISEGKTLNESMYMAQSALAQWIRYLEDEGQEIPKATLKEAYREKEGEFINYICADVKDAHAVKRTISIPRWLDDKAKFEGLSLSKILQDTLQERFG